MALYTRCCPLPRGRSIRIVRLDYTQVPGFVINLEMRVVDLDSDNSGYIGLSYTWGETIPTTPICINGAIVDIRQNLLEFLLEMQRQQEDSWYWIDALCINQDDLDEKTTQVRMMGDVYKCVRDIHNERILSDTR